MPPFVHDSIIPVKFALAVYAVLHNKAGPSDWNEINRHDRSAINWIQSIYKSNHLKWSQAEHNWWNRNLSKG